MPDRVDADALMHDVYLRLMCREGVVGVEPVPRQSLPDSRFLELKRINAFNHHQFFLFGKEIPVYRQGPFGKLELFVKRVIRKLLGWYSRPQVEFNEAVTRGISECFRHFTSVAAEVSALRREIGRSAFHHENPLLFNTSSDADNLNRQFDEKYRPSAAEIQARQRPYVSSFKGCSPVLDIGSGRGEFLGLLRELGVVGYGVEGNPELAAEGVGKGLKILREDPATHLHGLPLQSLGGVHLFGMIERMPPAEFSRLIKLARDRLNWGGLLIVEAINPCCEEAMRTFYFDPARLRPTHPELLRFLGENAGYAFSHFVFTGRRGGPAPETVRVGGWLEKEDVSAFPQYAAVFHRN